SHDRLDVVIGIEDLITSRSIADLQHHRIPAAAVDEVMGRAAGSKTDAHSWTQRRLTRLCRWRSADIEPGVKRVRFTPKFLSPNRSPSGRFSRPAIRDAK